MEKLSKGVVPTTVSGSGRYGPALSAALWAVFVLFAVNGLLYMLSTTSPHARADVWRHLDEIVIPYLDGSAGIGILWSNHHASPLLHIIQMVNLKNFGLRMDYDAWLGFSFQLVTGFIILRGMMISYVRAGAGPEGRDAQFYLCLVLVIAILFGFNARQQYTWPLLATVQYLYFFAIILFIAVDRCLKSPGAGAYIAVGFASLVFYFANMSYGSVFQFSMLGALASVWLVERKAAYIKVASVLVLVWALYYFTHLLLAPSAPYKPSASMWNVVLGYLRDPIATATKVSAAVSSGLLDVNLMRKTAPGAERFLVGLSWALLLTVLATFVVYLKKGLHRVTVIPLAFMFVLVFFALPALINRWTFIGENHWYLASARYAATFKFVAIGTLWAMLLIKARTLTGGRSIPGRPVYLASIALIVLLLMVQGFQIYKGWSAARSLAAENRKESLAIFFASDTRGTTTRIPFRASGYGGVRGSLDYIKKNRLNVFADNFPIEMVRMQVDARRKFDGATDTLGVLKGGEPGGTLYAEEGAELATWTADGNSVRIAGSFNGALLIRVKVDSGRHMLNAMTVSSGTQARPVDLVPGVQNLYFFLGDPGEVVVSARDGSEILEIELRF